MERTWSVPHNAAMYRALCGHGNEALGVVQVQQVHFHACCRGKVCIVSTCMAACVRRGTTLHLAATPPSGLCSVLSPGPLAEAVALKHQARMHPAPSRAFQEAARTAACAKCSPLPMDDACRCGRKGHDAWLHLSTPCVLFSSQHYTTRGVVCRAWR